MKKKSPLSRIDESVYLAMVLLCVVSIIVLAFRFKNYEPCQAIKITVNTSSFQAGYPIQFKAVSKNGKQYEWNFGDDSVQETNSSSAIHIYKKAGNYIVVLTVNKHCVEVQKLYIKEAPQVTSSNLLPIFVSPETALVNTPVTCKDATANATSWEWRFGESGIVDAISKEPTYMYKTPGIKTIYLKINGRSDQVAARVIYVKDPQPVKESVKPQIVAPPGAAKMLRMKNEPENPAMNQLPDKEKAEEPKPKAPEITNEQMGDGLEDILAGKKGADDFSKYLCDNLNLMVVYNGNAMTFLQMSNEIKQFKKIKKIQKPKVLLTVDGSTGCIKTMNVTIRKKNLFDQIF